MSILLWFCEREQNRIVRTIAITGVVGVASGGYAYAGAPSNDTCEAAFNLNSVLTAPSYTHSMSIDGTLATPDSIHLAAYQFDAEFTHGVWFTFTSPGAGYLVCEDPSHLFNLNDISRPGTIFTLASGCGTPAINGHEADPSLGTADPVLDREASVYRFSSAGETIKILVSNGVNGLAGPGEPFYNINFYFLSDIAPANDDCANAANIGADSFPYTTPVNHHLGASETSVCFSFHDVWYTYTAAIHGYLTFKETTAQPSVWAIASDCTSQPTCIGDDSVARYQLLEPGDVIRIMLSTPTPTYDLQLPLHPKFSLTTPPSNDECINAFSLNSVEFPFIIFPENFAALDDNTDCFSIFHGIWFTYTAAQTGYLISKNMGGSVSSALFATSAGCTSSATCVSADMTRTHMSAGQTVNIMVGNPEPLLIAPNTFELHFDFIACPADFNQTNGVTVQDIFDFLTAWLAGSNSADFNNMNGVTVQDIFDFLTAWLAGC